MKSIIKKISTLIVAFLMLFNIASFAESRQYSLYEFEQMLLDQNLQVVEAEELKIKKEKEYRDAVILSQSTQNSEFKEDPYDNYAVEVKEKLNPIKAQKAYADAAYSYENIKADKVQELKYKYFQIQYETELLNAQNESFSISKKIYDTKKKELELGLISEFDYIQAEKDYKSDFIEVLASTNKVARLKRELATMVNMEVTSDFTLRPQGFSASEYIIEDMEKLSLEIKEKSYTVEKVKLEKLIAETELSFKHRFAGFGEVKIEMEALQDQIDDSERLLSDALNDVDYRLLTDYNSVMIEFNNLEIANIDFERAIRENETAKLKFENGLISQRDYSISNNNIFKAKNKYMLARLAYYNEKENLKNYILINQMDFVN